MLVLLTIGAYCDHKCREVPDSVSFPFVFLGIMNAWFSQRYAGVVMAVGILVLLNRPRRIPLLHKIGQKMIDRAYGNSPENVKTEEERINALSDDFYSEHEPKISKLSCGAFTFFSTLSFALFSCYTRQSRLLLVVSGGIVILCNIALWRARVSSQDMTQEHESLEPMGGADMLTLLGMFSFWGFFRGLYAVTAMFVTTALVLIVKGLVKKEKDKSIPLLVYLAAEQPVGIAAALLLGSGAEFSYRSLFPWLTLF